jgi:hypothetical protein
MKVQYRAKCGRTTNFTLKSGQRSRKTERVLMETDVPLPGHDKPHERPEWCDPRCLYRHKPDDLTFMPGLKEGNWDGTLLVVKGYFCKFVRKDDEEAATDA